MLLPAIFLLVLLKGNYFALLALFYFLLAFLLDTFQSHPVLILDIAAAIVTLVLTLMWPFWFPKHKTEVYLPFLFFSIFLLVTQLLAPYIFLQPNR